MLWSLTPSTKWNWRNNRGIIDNSAKKSLQQLSNFKKQSIESIMKELLKTKTAQQIYEESKRWVDFDYVMGLEYLIKSTDPLADDVMKLIINNWINLSFPTVLAKIGGLSKFKEVIAMLYEYEPEIFNYLKSQWPNVEDYI